MGTSNSFGLGLNELALANSGLTQPPTYEKWSTNAGGFESFQMPPMRGSGGGNSHSHNGVHGQACMDNAGSLGPNGEPSLFELSKLMSTTSLYPPRSQIKRQKMIYHCKFGEFGVMEGQFTEPSGVAVNAQNDIIVADTNNHRIQIFDKEGRFKFQFGECGKRDGQLLYPNRVSVVKTSGDIIVTERSPTHQIQIYNQYGQFARKFGANVLQHPRGVTVDSKGRIIVVECKVMRVIIFDQMGNVLHKFGFPSTSSSPTASWSTTSRRSSSRTTAPTASRSSATRASSCARSAARASPTIPSASASTRPARSSSPTTTTTSI